MDMFRGKFIFTVTLGLVWFLMVLSTQAAQSQVEEETLVWNLKQTSVVDPGQTDSLPADPKSDFPGGILTSGFTLEAKAKTKSGKLVPEGTFHLTLSAFQPDKDTPTQKAGLWHVEGNWTIIDKNANPEALKTRHNPYTVKGKIHAVLPFNPATDRKNWSAEISVPMSQAAGQWARGSEGSLTFDDRYEGDLFLVVKLWPKN